MTITEKYNKNLDNYVTNDVRTLVKIIENFFYPNLYYHTDQGFHLCANKNLKKFPSDEFIAYGICGLYDHYPVNRDFTLKRLYKKSKEDTNNPFQYKKLFIPEENTLDYIHCDSQILKKELPLEHSFKGDRLFLTRCSHLNHTNRKELNLTAGYFFNLLVKTFYNIYECNDKSILDEIDEIGGIEINPSETALRTLKEYFSSNEFLNQISCKEVSDLFKEFSNRIYPA